MYRVGFAQFLRWAAKEYNKPEYNEFAEGLKYKVKTEGKNPNALLTKKRIHKPLTEDMVQRFVHKAAMKAGIKKRVYPH
jgi:site-specific recombinase XerD